MELFTRSKESGWDRIVDIYVERGEKVSPYINDSTTYKLVVMQKGEIRLQEREEVCLVKAPALILLTHKDQVECTVVKPVRLVTLYLKPTVIRDEFTYERIEEGEFTYEKTQGQTIFQDYVLIQAFTLKASLSQRAFSLPLNVFTKLNGIIGAIEHELTQQADGFWPCRSRSYLVELLYFISYTYVYRNGAKESVPKKDDIAGMIEFLHEHINESMSLDRLTKEFSVNRNKLNELFLTETSMTCLAYLTKLRIDLAKIMLAETELPIGVVGGRVGFEDSNYFTKVFKQQVGVTPTNYRRQ